MSDTPETDHAALLPKAGAGWRGVVLVDFARQLERERDAARSDLAYRLEQYAIKQLQLAEARKTILELQKK